MSQFSTLALGLGFPASDRIFVSSRNLILKSKISFGVADWVFTARRTGDLTESANPMQPAFETGNARAFDHPQRFAVILPIQGCAGLNLETFAKFFRHNGLAFAAHNTCHGRNFLHS